MAIPFLKYAPSAPNVRVAGFEVGGDEQAKIYDADKIISSKDMGDLIEAAYRQIFFHAFKSDREVVLESQLRNGHITVRDFIRGLLLSQTFKSSFYDKNSNYRFVEHCIQRVLGRDVYSEKEKIAWSIVVVTKGLKGFVDELLDTEEYLDNFGFDIVPYQRRRVLSSRNQGEIPFNIKSPRYDAYYRSILGFPQIVWQSQVRRYVPQDQKPKTGSPELFLNMAKSITKRATATSPTSALNIDYLQKVPKR